MARDDQSRNCFVCRGNHGDVSSSETSIHIDLSAKDGIADATGAVLTGTGALNDIRCSGSAFWAFCAAILGMLSPCMYRLPRDRASVISRSLKPQICSENYSSIFANLHNRNLNPVNVWIFPVYAEPRSARPVSGATGWDSFWWLVAPVTAAPWRCRLRSVTRSGRL